MNKSKFQLAGQIGYLRTVSIINATVETVRCSKCL